MASIAEATISISSPVPQPSGGAFAAGCLYPSRLPLNRNSRCVLGSDGDQVEEPTNHFAAVFIVDCHSSTKWSPRGEVQIQLYE